MRIIQQNINKIVLLHLYVTINYYYYYCRILDKVKPLSIVVCSLLICFSWFLQYVHLWHFNFVTNMYTKILILSYKNVVIPELFSLKCQFSIKNIFKTILRKVAHEHITWPIYFFTTSIHERYNEVQKILSAILNFFFSFQFRYSNSWFCYNFILLHYCLGQT